MRASKTARVSGSSPLARGTSYPPGLCGRDARLIPARAGNIFLPTFRGVPGAAHPRSRGEHALREGELARECGSSPLARGTFNARKIRRTRNRLIPARAGNILALSPVNSGAKAHPRSRGEHDGGGSPLQPGAGSSPLARGTLSFAKISRISTRLIPARAGNIKPPSLTTPAPPAHPRSRGEHEDFGISVQDSGGSSPLARGTWVGSGEVCREFRLIPARAGNIALTGRSLGDV